MPTREQSGKQERLTDAKLGQLTGLAVERLNREARKSVMSWVAMGKIVHAFVTVLRKTRCNEDPFKLLAAYPESLHEPNQLRNYEACFRLWQELGGENGAPAVSMTHFVIVLSQEIEFDEKKRLLEKAAQEKLSVAQLKQYICGEPEPTTGETEQPQSSIGEPARGDVEPVVTAQKAVNQPTDNEDGMPNEPGSGL